MPGASIFRNAGIIRGRVLYEEIQYLNTEKKINGATSWANAQNDIYFTKNVRSCPEIQHRKWGPSCIRSNNKVFDEFFFGSNCDKCGSCLQKIALNYLLATLLYLSWSFVCWPLWRSLRWVSSTPFGVPFRLPIQF